MKYSTISDSRTEFHILFSLVVGVAVPAWNAVTHVKLRGNTTGLQFHYAEQIGKLSMIVHQTLMVIALFLLHQLWLHKVSTGDSRNSKPL